MIHRVVCLSVLSIGVLAVLSGCASPIWSDQVQVAAAGMELPVIPDGVVSRAVTWENRKGEPGAGGQAGGGRKGSACMVNVKAGTTATLMDIDGCGVVRHIWITVPHRKPEHLRNMILRMYWDNSPVPSVEVPLGDFFGTAHGQAVPLTSAYTTMTLGKGFNCFFPMPFATHATITVENDMADDTPIRMLFFQIDYEQHESLPANTGRFHAQFRRQNPTIEKQDYVILDNVEGPGMFVGCVIGVRPLSGHWWGEGEMKFYMDGDTDYPTICGTGSEDYFCAAWGMGLYQTPYHGCTLLLKNDFFKHSLVSMYRWHVKDPVYFRKSLKATMQQIGHNGKRLYERSDDWCSVAYWYQLKPVKQQPLLPDRAARTTGLIEPVKPKAESKMKPKAKAKPKENPKAKSETKTKSKATSNNTEAAAGKHSAVIPVPRKDKKWITRNESFNARAKKGDVDLVFIGDSITHGWDGRGKPVWQKYYSHRKPMNLGIGGDRTQHVLWRLDNGNIDGISPKAAVLMIGTNNTKADGNAAMEIGEGIAAIVKKLRAKLPKTKVLVLAIFPRGQQPDDPKRAKNATASKIASLLADEKMVYYMDIGANFTNPDGTISTEIMPDYLHLTPRGYEIWAEAIEPKLRELLGEKP